ncbi:MAG: hypothetical protein GX651_02870 [Methanomicrobiales archaeon]|nr:hypothetical protein [Methanomicrobiales archaeon]
MTHERCLEVILVHGDGSQVKVLAKKLMSHKGVESVKLTMIAIES